MLNIFQALINANDSLEPPSLVLTTIVNIETDNQETTECCLQKHLWNVIFYISENLQIIFFYSATSCEFKVSKILGTKIFYFIDIILKALNNPLIYLVNVLNSLQ